MHALSPSTAQVSSDVAVQAPASIGTRWRQSMTAMAPAAATFVSLQSLLFLPHNAGYQLRWLDLLVVSAFYPAVSVAVLVPLAAGATTLIRAGRGRSLALVAAAVSAAALGTALDAAVTYSIWPGPPWSRSATAWSNFGWSAILCAAAILIYDARMRALQRAAALRELRLERARVVRRTVETQMQAMQARVDPRFLFDTMAAAERIYESDAAAGDRLLDALIAYLRAVLPDLHNATSMLGKQIDLATAWLAIQRVLRSGQLTIATEAADDVRPARFPSLTVIPLLEELLAQAPPSAVVTVSARREGPRLLLNVRRAGTVDGRAPEESGSVTGLRTRLRDLYGDAASLFFAASAVRGYESTLELPYEDSDGADR